MISDQSLLLSTTVLNDTVSSSFDIAQLYTCTVFAHQSKGAARSIVRA